MKITLENLNKIYIARSKGYSEQIVAVRDVSFVYPEGKMVCLLGPSGCGKSTLLSLINGLETPDSGKIYFGDEDVTEWPPEKRAVGMVFQNYALYSHMSVRQNIRMPLENPFRGETLDKREQERKVEEIADLIQIRELLDRRPDELSGGQQQRVSIARALVRRPEILLLDEPLSNLDKMLRMQILEEIRKIQEDLHVTTVFVTHDQEEAMGIADLIVVMRDGMIQQAGSPEEVYRFPDNIFTARFLGYPEINLVSGSVRSGKLYCGSDLLFDSMALEDQDVIIGIRPEDLELREDGVIVCRYSRSEIQGKDRILVCEYHGAVLKSILPTGFEEVSEGEVRFSCKKEKLMLFSPETGNRIVL